MLIKFKRNDSDLFEDRGRFYSSPLNEVVEIGKLYIVYGITFFEKGVFFEILTTHDFYPKSYPSMLFDIVDNRLSRLFVLGEKLTGDYAIVPFISFKEWVGDPKFYERLVDSDEKAELIFRQIKEMMSLEHKLPDITNFALSIEEKWVQCVICYEAWELQYPDFEMCKCPNCGTVMLIPRSLKT